MSPVNSNEEVSLFFDNTRVRQGQESDTHNTLTLV